MLCAIGETFFVWTAWIKKGRRSAKCVECSVPHTTPFTSIFSVYSRQSGALDGLRESSSAVLDFRLLGEGLEGKDFFNKMNP